MQDPAGPDPGWRDRVKAARRTAAQVPARLQDARTEHNSVDLALAFSERDRLVGGGLLAGALAFRLFLWVLPAALTVVGLLGFRHPIDSAALAGRTGWQALTVQSVSDAAANAHRGRWVAVLLGLFLLYFASVALARAVWVAILLAWGQPPRRLESTPKAAGITVAALLAGFAAAATAQWARDSSDGLGILTEIVLVFVWAGLWWAVQLTFPRPDSVSRLQLWPGAALFGLGTLVMHLVTVVYLVRKISSASVLYGGLGAAAVILLWGYLAARLVIATAGLNWTMATRREAMAARRDG